MQLEYRVLKVHLVHKAHKEPLVLWVQLDQPVLLDLVELPEHLETLDLRVQLDHQGHWVLVEYRGPLVHQVLLVQQDLLD